MSSFETLKWLLITLIPALIALLVFMRVHRRKYFQLRYLYERLCICLVHQQVVGREDEVMKSSQNLLPESTHFVTALEFLEEPGKHEPGKQGGRLIMHLEELSTSIFAGRMINLLATSVIITLLIVAGGLFLLGAAQEFVQMTGGNGVWPLYIGGVIGIAVSFATVLFLLMVNFGKHADDILLLADRWPLWQSGSVSRPANRRIIPASQDPDYQGLSSKTAFGIFG